MKNNFRTLIGISGASGSGKTLLAKTLLQKLDPNQILILHEDSYYLDLSHLKFEDRVKFNFDHPDALDHDLLISHLKLLLNGKHIEQPVYDFKTHTRKKDTLKIFPKNVIILEGILILSVPEIRKLLDIKIFVDTPADICFIRRLKRDIVERARSVDSVIRQYEETVRPMYLEYVEPSKIFADLIVPHGGENTIAIDIISTKIIQLLGYHNKTNAPNN